MLDSTATKLAAGAIENVKPTSPAEFYVLVIVSGLVVCWGIFWYFKSKKGGESASNNRQNGSEPTNENVYRLHPEDRARLERVEEGVRTLAEAFRGIVHERGELMEKIGELRGRVNSMQKD